MKGSWTLGKISGIEIGVHYTWLFAFGLISFSLARGFFPQLYPGWAYSTYWLAGALSALFLFFSVLVHELSHSFVARARGLPVEGITLFIFGGISRLGEEAESAWDEFSIAVVGPITSAVLAAVFWAMRITVADTGGPVGAILAYLALVNLLLAIFNLLPGFPLDGGRVLRSLIWGSTGSLVRATNAATTVGQVFGWTLIAIGFLMVLRGEFLSGLWMAFIGWFLNGAAESSRAEVTSRAIFRKVRIGDVMNPEPEVVPPSVTADEIINENFLRRGQRAVPVCEDGRLVGIVTVSDLKALPHAELPTTSVASVMTSDPIYSLGTDDDLSEALNLMAQHNIHQVLVTDNGSLVGIVSRSHVIRYLQGWRELGLGGRDEGGAE